MTRQIIEIPSLKIQEQIVEVTKTVPQERVQQHTGEQGADAPVHADHQPGVPIQLFKGECAQKEGNNLLSEFHLDGSQSAPCGALQVEVAFVIKRQ